MPKLNQILSVERQVKNTAETEFTKIYQNLLKPALLVGQQRTYRPKDEDGEKYRDESQRVQLKAEEQLKKMKESLTKLFDTTATKDYTNCVAKADVVVDGQVLVKDCPATHLLFLDKKLTDLITVAKKLPVLDQTEEWKKDDALGLWATKPVETVKGKKVTEPLVLVQPTKEHPAQVKEVSKDVIAGHWTTIKYSGALPQDRVDEIINRLEAVQKAVRFARQEANNVQAIELSSSTVLNFIFQ